MVKHELEAERFREMVREGQDLLRRLHNQLEWRGGAQLILGPVLNQRVQKHLETEV